MSDTGSRLHASTDTSRGLERFRDDLDPAVVDEIAGWAADAELGKLCASLGAIRDREKFLNTYAEAMVARYLLARDCRLRVEVPTPTGRTSDFEVALGEHCFFLHVKRLNTDRVVRRRLTVSSRLRYLERISRPYVVSVRFADGLTDEQMQRYVTAAAEFIGRARVGDELVIRDDDGTEIGGCRIVAPWQGSRVTLVIGLPSGFIDETPRIRRLMRKAYQQFMPGAANVILICSSHVEDADDFGTALLGSHIERWDAHPPRGRRIAHGRDSDGFWFRKRSPESAAAGWFHFRPGASALQCRLWIRPDSALDEPLQQALVGLFNGRHA
jgi:hypothetical protein